MNASKCFYSVFSVSLWFNYFFQDECRLNDRLIGDVPWIFAWQRIAGLAYNAASTEKAWLPRTADAGKREIEENRSNAVVQLK